jgi:hypothetical protein
MERAKPYRLILLSDPIRPFQENKSPKNGEFSEGKTSGLGGFNSWNYLRSFTFYEIRNTLYT